MEWLVAKQLWITIESDRWIAGSSIEDKRTGTASFSTMQCCVTVRNETVLTNWQQLCLRLKFTCCSQSGVPLLQQLQRRNAYCVCSYQGILPNSSKVHSVNEDYVLPCAHHCHPEMLVCRLTSCNVLILIWAYTESPIQQRTQNTGLPQRNAFLNTFGGSSVAGLVCECLCNSYSRT